MAFKTIMIDDEKLALSRLKRLLDEYPYDFDIIHTAANGEEGWQSIEKLQPEIIFLDIEMPVLNGFEMLSKLSYMPFVVFTTAFEEYAIRAFEENSIDYLLKPIEQERLEITVQKLRKFKDRQDTNGLSSSQLMQMIAQLKPKQMMTSISVKIGDKILLIRLNEIAYFEAEDKYVNVYTKEGKKHLVDYSLVALEEKLPENFKRVSRAAIVNSSFIKEIQKFFNGKYVLVLNDATQSKITSGSSYTDKIKKIFEL